MHENINIIDGILQSFKDSSPGIDDIPMRIIKENIATLSDVICFICNLSL